jgi:hypothetical protein
MAGPVSQPIKNYTGQTIILKKMEQTFAVAILKMEISRNFSMSGINSGHHNLSTYEISLKSNNVEFVQYCGGHFENGDWYKFFDARNQFGTS